MWWCTSVSFISSFYFQIKLSKKKIFFNWYNLPNFGQSSFHTCSDFPVKHASLDFCCWWCISMRLYKFYMIVVFWDGKDNITLILATFPSLLYLKRCYVKLSKNFFSRLNQKHSCYISTKITDSYTCMHSHLFLVEFIHIQEKLLNLKFHIVEVSHLFRVQQCL